MEWNDVSWMQGVAPWWVTKVLRFCYASGYSAMMLVPMLPCFLRGDFLQGWRYVLSGHLLQSVIIFPFLVVFSVQEVWWVKHIPDGLERIFENDMVALKCSYNCFPSMHTSMATAMAIVAWKEKDSWFRWGWIGYCGCVIFSTVYFPIHWVLDLLGGVVLGGVSAWVGGRLATKIDRSVFVFLNTIKIKKDRKVRLIKKEND